MKVKELINELIELYRYVGDVDVQMGLLKSGKPTQWYTITSPSKRGVLMLEEANNES
jgi:hypothetical protein